MSVFFGVLTVALLVLWVRSYWRMDVLVRDAPEEQQIISSLGRIKVTLHKQALPGTLRTNWNLESHPQKTLASKSAATRQTSYTGFPGFVRSMRFSAVSLPYWLLVVISSSATVLPIRVRRFSLRTMLIGTTLVAVVLGLAVWAVR
jgi:hypothetical protein